VLTKSNRLSAPKSGKHGKGCYLDVYQAGSYPQKLILMVWPHDPRAQMARADRPALPRPCQAMTIVDSRSCLMASLRDAGTVGRLLLPGLERPGYRQGVATRRSGSAAKPSCVA
jgi:hypothetical protein